LRDPRLARRQRIGITLAGDDEVGAIVANARHLRRRRDGRHEDPGRHAKLHRRIGDGGAVIAARRRGDTSRGHLAHEQVGEGAARLERSGMLQQLELEADGGRAEAELGAIDLDDGRAADVRPDEPLGRRDSLAIDAVSAHVHHCLPPTQRARRGPPAADSRNRLDISSAIGKLAICLLQIRSARSPTSADC
jgi:hypothetical protein